MERMKMMSFCFLLVLTLGMGACKKDGMVIRQEKEFIQVLNQPVTSLGDGGMNLILKPDGMANFSPGGDILWSATYTINRNKITVKVPQLNTSYTFNIISDEEIQSNSGIVLKLLKP